MKQYMATTSSSFASLPHILVVHIHSLIQLFLAYTHTHAHLCNSYCFVIFRIFQAIHLIGASEVTRTCFCEFSYTITFTRLPEIVKVHGTIKPHFQVGKQTTEHTHLNTRTPHTHVHTHLLQTHILARPVGRANIYSDNPTKYNTS